MGLTIIPQVWSEWILQQIPFFGNLLKMGLVNLDASPVFQKGDTMHRVPKQKHLNNIGDDIKIENDTTLTPVGLDDFQEVGVIIHRGNSFKVSSLDELIKNAKLMQKATSQIAEYNSLQIQKSLVSATKGAFATALVGTHVLDISELGDGAISDGNIIDAKSKMGETSDEMTAIIMHSKIKAQLQKQGLIKYIDAGAFGQTLLVKGTIPTFLGMRVIVNDTMCASFTENTFTKYPTFITGGQPWYVGYQKQLRIDSEKKILVGGITYNVAWYVDYVPHLNGLSWGGAVNPTRAALEAGGSWTKVEEDENIKIVKLITQLAA